MVRSSSFETYSGVPICIHSTGILFFLFIIGASSVIRIYKALLLTCFYNSGSSYINLVFISVSSVNVRMKPVISISKGHIHSLI